LGEGNYHFLDSMPQKKDELKKTKTFMTHYRKY